MCCIQLSLYVARMASQHWHWLLKKASSRYQICCFSMMLTSTSRTGYHFTLLLLYIVFSKNYYVLCLPFMQQWCSEGGIFSVVSFCVHVGLFWSFVFVRAITLEPFEILWYFCVSEICSKARMISKMAAFRCTVACEWWFNIYDVLVFLTVFNKSVLILIICGTNLLLLSSLKTTTFISEMNTLNQL